MTLSVPCRVLLLATLALTGGCAVGPHYRAPVETPVAVGAPDPALSSATAVPSGGWWTIYDDPVLTDLIGRANRSNLDLRQALARVKAARAAFADAELDRFPRVTSEASYARSKSQRPGQATDRVTVEQSQVGFDAAWELDLFGRVGHAVEAAKAQAEAADFDAKDAAVTVAAEVAREYMLLRGAQARRLVAEANAKTQEETLQLTQARVSAGRGDPVDLQSARAHLEATRATIPVLALVEIQARYRLAVLVGERPGALDDLLAPTRDLPGPSAKALPLGEVGQVLRRRPDVRAAEPARTGVPTADLFPRVRVTGFVGLLSGDLSALTHEGAEAWAVSPAISWPALDFGGAHARLRAQEARGEASLAAYDQTVLRAVEDLRGALDAYGQHQRQIASLSARMAAAREAARLAKARYDVGDIDFLRVLDAERSRLDAEDALTDAEVAANIDVVAIYKALGGA